LITPPNDVIPTLYNTFSQSASISPKIAYFAEKIYFWENETQNLVFETILQNICVYFVHMYKIPMQTHVFHGKKRQSLQKFKKQRFFGEKMKKFLDTFA
jgi:hypothetical protein